MMKQLATELDPEWRLWILGGVSLRKSALSQTCFSRPLFGCPAPFPTKLKPPKSNDFSPYFFQFHRLCSRAGPGSRKRSKSTKATPSWKSQKVCTHTHHCTHHSVCFSYDLRKGLCICFNWCAFPHQLNSFSQDPVVCETGIVMYTTF